MTRTPRQKPIIYDAAGNITHHAQENRITLPRGMRKDMKQFCKGEIDAESHNRLTENLLVLLSGALDDEAIQYDSLEANYLSLEARITRLEEPLRIKQEGKVLKLIPGGRSA